MRVNEHPRLFHVTAPPPSPRGMESKWQHVRDVHSLKIIFNKIDVNAYGMYHHDLEHTLPVILEIVSRAFRLLIQKFCILTI